MFGNINGKTAFLIFNQNFNLSNQNYSFHGNHVTLLHEREVFEDSNERSGRTKSDTPS